MLFLQRRAGECGSNSPLSQVREGPSEPLQGARSPQLGTRLPDSRSGRGASRELASLKVAGSPGELEQPQVEVNRLSRAGGALGTRAWEGEGPCAGGLGESREPLPQRRELYSLFPCVFSPSFQKLPKLVFPPEPLKSHERGFHPPFQPENGFHHKTSQWG